VESLFHLASFHPAPGDPDPEGSPEHHQVSVQGTRNLLAQLEGVRRIVFASSVRAGEASATAYGAAKREAEGLLGAFCEARGISLVIVRFPAFYGTPGLGGLATMADAVRRGRFPPIPEFGNRRAFIHVADAARALVAAWDSPQAAGKVLVATDGEAYSTRRIYLAMRASAGVPPPAITPPGWLFHAMAPAGDLAGRLLKRRFPFNREVLDKLAGSAWHDDQELRRLTNYRPHHNIEQALERGEI
jgi:nucleoside-diphosphate-sugar epimerase